MHKEVIRVTGITVMPSRAEGCSEIPVSGKIGFADRPVKPAGQLM